MSEPKARVWKKIVCFYALTMLFSSVCGAFVLHAGKMDAGNLLYVTGAMNTGEYSNDRFIGEMHRPADPKVKDRIKEVKVVKKQAQK